MPATPASSAGGGVAARRTSWSARRWRCGGHGPPGHRVVLSAPDSSAASRTVQVWRDLTTLGIDGADCPWSPSPTARAGSSPRAGRRSTRDPRGHRADQHGRCTTSASPSLCTASRLNGAVREPLTSGSTTFLTRLTVRCRASKDVSAPTAPTPPVSAEGMAHFVATCRRRGPPITTPPTASRGGERCARSPRCCLGRRGTGLPAALLDSLMRHARTDVHRFEPAPAARGRDIATPLFTWLERLGTPARHRDPPRASGPAGRTTFVPFFAELDARRRDAPPWWTWAPSPPAWTARRAGHPARPCELGAALRLRGPLAVACCAPGCARGTA
ncbi:hypothetical protein QJS66_00940 [Kocuria rhizophila]|nr:hypothetical protein QJS66_00940 [Kocuria rhizophila]